MPEGGNAQGMSVNNPTGYNVLILDGTRTLYSVPPSTVITLPVQFNGGQFSAQMDATQRALGIPNSDSVATITLSPLPFPASSASLSGMAGGRLYSLLYQAAAAGPLDAQLIIPSGYKRRMYTNVSTDISGVFIPDYQGGSLTSLTGPTVESTAIFQAGAAAGAVNLDPFPSSDSYVWGMSAAGTVILTLEGMPGASPVQVHPHGANRITTLSLTPGQQQNGTGLVYQ